MPLGLFAVVSGGFVPALALLAFSTAIGALYQTRGQTALQQRVPAEILGRVNGVMRLLLYAGMLAGAVVAVALVDELGWSTLIAGTAVAAIALYAVIVLTLQLVVRSRDEVALTGTPLPQFSDQPATASRTPFSIGRPADCPIRSRISRRGLRGSHPARQEIGARRLHFDVGIRNPNGPGFEPEAGRLDERHEVIDLEEAEIHVHRHAEHVVCMFGRVPCLAEVHRNEEEPVLGQDTMELAERIGHLRVADQVDDRVEGGDPGKVSVRNVELRHRPDLEGHAGMEHSRALDHRRRKVNTGDRQPELGKERTDVARSASHVADGGAVTEVLADLFPERGFNRPRSSGLWSSLSWTRSVYAPATAS